MTDASKMSASTAAAVMIMLCLLPASGSAWVLLTGSAVVLAVRLRARRSDRRAAAVTATFAAVIAAIITLAVYFLAHP